VGFAFYCSDTTPRDSIPSGAAGSSTSWRLLMDSDSEWFFPSRRHTAPKPRLVEFFSERFQD